MKVVHELPPNWEILKQHFSVEWGKTVVTYGDTCYAKYPLSESLRVHEQVHVRQQVDPKSWWEKYIAETSFRLSQELEAYKEQFKFLKQTIRDRNHLFREKDKLVRDLSGPMYANMIGYLEVNKLL